MLTSTSTSLPTTFAQSSFATFLAWWSAATTAAAEQLQQQPSSIPRAAHELGDAELQAQSLRLVHEARDVAVDGNRMGGRDPAEVLGSMKAALDALPGYVVMVATCNAAGTIGVISLLTAAMLLAMQQHPVRDARAVLVKVLGGMWQSDGPAAAGLQLVQQALTDMGAMVQRELRQRYTPSQHSEAHEAWLQRVLAAIPHLASDDGAAASAAADELVGLMTPTLNGGNFRMMLDAGLQQLCRLFGDDTRAQPAERYELLLNPSLRSSSGAKDTPVMSATATLVQLAATFARAAAVLPVARAATVEEGERQGQYFACMLPCCLASRRCTRTDRVELALA